MRDSYLKLRYRYKHILEKKDNGYYNYDKIYQDEHYLKAIDALCPEHGWFEIDFRRDIKKAIICPMCEEVNTETERMERIAERLHMLYGSNLLFDIPYWVTLTDIVDCKCPKHGKMSFPFKYIIEGDAVCKYCTQPNKKHKDKPEYNNL